MSLNSYNLLAGDLLGQNSRMALLTLEGSNLIVQDTEWMPQYIEDFDVDTISNRVYVAIEAVSSEGITIYQDPLPVFGNDAVDKDSELQILSIKNNSLIYVAGKDLGQFGVQVKACPGSKRFALITASALVSDVFDSTSPVFGPTRRPAATELHIYTVHNDGKIDHQDSSSAPVLALDIAFNEDCSRASTIGITTYSEFSTRKAGQKGYYLYKLTANNE